MGGSVSLAVKILITIYVVINVKKMIFNEDDKLVSILSILDVNEAPVMYNETNILSFVVIRKQIGPI